MPATNAVEAQARDAEAEKVKATPLAAQPTATRLATSIHPSRPRTQATSLRVCVPPSGHMPAITASWLTTVQK